MPPLSTTYMTELLQSLVDRDGASLCLPMLPWRFSSMLRGRVAPRHDHPTTEQYTEVAATTRTGAVAIVTDTTVGG